MKIPRAILSAIFSNIDDDCASTQRDVAIAVCKMIEPDPERRRQIGINVSKVEYVEQCIDELVRRGRIIRMDCRENHICLPSYLAKLSPDERDAVAVRRTWRCSAGHTMQGVKIDLPEAKIVAEFLAERAAGRASVMKMANRYGVNRQNMYTLLRRHGVKFPPRKKSEGEAEDDDSWPTESCRSSFYWRKPAPQFRERKGGNALDAAAFADWKQRPKEM